MSSSFQIRITREVLHEALEYWLYNDFLRHSRVNLKISEFQVANDGDPRPFVICLDGPQEDSA